MSKTPKTDELVWMEQSGEYCGELVETAICSLRTAETTIANMVEWLEKNQPDVFSRGLWDVLTANAGTEARQARDEEVKP